MPTFESIPRTSKSFPGRDSVLGGRAGAPTGSVRIPPALATNPVWMEWRDKANAAQTYWAASRPKFSNRDRIYDESFKIRFGEVKAKIPPSHREIVQQITSKEANEILARLTAILTSVYPDWIYHPDGLSTAAGLRASELSNFVRSMWLGIEDSGLLPIIRQLTDQQLGYGGGMLKIHSRLDRWANLPFREVGESDKDFAQRTRVFKADNIPFDITVPEYNTIYYDLTTDGLVRVFEIHRASVYEVAEQFGGHYDDKRGRLEIPIEVPNPKFNFEEPESIDNPEFIHEHISVATRTEVDYSEFWVKGSHVIFQINNTPVMVEQLEPGMDLPYFLALGEVTSSPDPGRMGLPILYNAHEMFLRKLNLRAMEDSFLYKHGFARLIHFTEADPPGAVEPDLPDQEEEEEQIGEVLDAKFGREDWEYLTPANVSVLFANALADTNREIESTALADVLTGRLPPSGTTGFLMSQLASAAVSKYVPILTQTARAIRLATLFMLRLTDDVMESPIVVRAQTKESTVGQFLSYKPGFSRGNENLEVRIEAPLPSDQIAKTQFLIVGNEKGYITRERVQREGYRVDQPELEDEKSRIERFKQFYEPIAMLRAMQRSGQMDQVLEAARAGVLPPAIQQLALSFAAGPDGQQAQPGANPNGVIQAAPGLGEPGVPTVAGGSSLQGIPGAVRGRASGAERRPANQGTSVAAPVNPRTP